MSFHFAVKSATLAAFAAASMVMFSGSPAAAGPTFQIVVPVDTTALSAKGYLPGWLALTVKCDLMSYHDIGTPAATKVGSGIAQHVPAKADAFGKPITMVTVSATETPAAAVHATYSCTASVDSIAGGLHLNTEGGPVTGAITNNSTTSAPLVLTLASSNPPPIKYSPAKVNPGILEHGAMAPPTPAAVQSPPHG